MVATTAGRRQRLRPGQSGDPAGKAAPAPFTGFCQLNPETVPDHRHVRCRRSQNSRARHSISTSAPTCRATGSGATARWWRSRPISWRIGATISVAFVLGCSFSFEEALMADDLPMRHIECGVRVPMYRTNIACSPSGPFAGPMVVSMRPLKPADAIRAVQITSRFPSVHGAPVHLGHPHSIGIADIAKPDYGDPVPIARRRDSGVLGLRRHTASRDRGSQAAVRDHACAGTDAGDRPEEQATRCAQRAVNGQRLLFFEALPYTSTVSIDSAPINRGLCR